MTLAIETILAGLVPLVGMIFWVGQLAGSVKAQGRRLDVAETKISDMDSTVVKELARLREEFAELKGYLKATHKES